MKTLYQTKEVVIGDHPNDEWIAYDLNLVIKDSGKTPVQMNLTYEPPQPTFWKMPEKKIIKADTITDAYVKLSSFLKSYGYTMKARKK